MAKLRQFYFDDGKSRKRWRILTEGKSHTVSYGRLTGALRETTKRYASTSAAKQHTERLIAQKLRDGYVQIDPARLELVRTKGRRRATDKQLQRLEEQLGVSLPHEYREFLASVNGGRPNPEYVQIPARSDIDNVGVGTFFHLRPAHPTQDELTYEINRTADLLPDGYLPFAGDSDLFTLSLKPKTFGAVYWWFHESNEVDDDGNFLESAGHLLASSFNEFLTRIAGVFGNETTSESLAASEKANASKVTTRTLLRVVRQRHTPATVKEIKRTVRALGDLSGIKDGHWPFINISDAAVLGCLLDAGLNPEITDKERHSLLYQCATCPDCIDLLVKKGANLDRRSGAHGETPLMRAIFLEDIPAVKRLAKHGANPTLRLPKHVASHLKYNPKLAKAVEQAQAKWKNRAARKREPIAAETKPQATKSGPKPSIPRLLRLLKPHLWIQEGEHLKDVEEQVAALGDLSGIQSGQWPEIRKFEDPHLLAILLDAGLDQDITDKGGNPLLWQCASHPDCIALLANRGATVDQANKVGETPLMRACSQGGEDCVQALLDAGADPTIEFSQFAQVLLNMDDEMSEFINSARMKWRRKRKRKPK